MQVVVEGMRVMGYGAWRTLPAFVFCHNTARGSFKACIYSSLASQNPAGIFFVTQTVHPPVNLQLATIDKIANPQDPQVNQDYWISWHRQLAGRYQMVMVEYLQLGG